MDIYRYKDPNVFRPDNNFIPGADVQPQPIRCPHCRHLGSAHMIPNVGASYQKAMIRQPGNREVPAGLSISLHRCPNPPCGGLILIIYNRTTGDRRAFPPELVDFDPNGLPPRCQQTIAEAAACLGAGAYRASAMMIRRLLEEVCEENGAEGDSLHQRLEALATKIVLPQALFTAMNELKLLGNDAAHIKAKHYDEIGKDEAEAAIDLAKEIMKGLYQLHGLVARLQSKKKPGGPAATPA